MKLPAVSLLVAVTLLPATAVVHSQRGSRPNIIFIMTDDHAAHAIGVWLTRDP